MSFEQYAIVKLRTNPIDDFILLSYPGMETNGTVVVAPLVAEDKIAVVEILHPVVETPFGRRVIAVERLAGVAPELVSQTSNTLIANEHVIQRAISRLFYGN